MRARIVLLAAGALLAAAAVGAQQVTKQPVDGITNFARLETTVACGGATKPEAIPALKKMGFASLINLRLPTEKDANIEQVEAATKAAGMNFVHIPFNGSSPDPAAVDRFLDEIAKPANEPAYIQCASANRAAMMWMAKRLVIDKWDVQRAGDEAAQLGLTSSTLKDFIVTYSMTHKR